MMLVEMISGILITSKPAKLFTFEARETISDNGLPGVRERSGKSKSRFMRLASTSVRVSNCCLSAFSSGESMIISMRTILPNLRKNYYQVSLYLSKVKYHYRHQ